MSSSAGDAVDLVTALRHKETGIVHRRKVTHHTRQKSLSTRKQKQFDNDVFSGKDAVDWIIHHEYNGVSNRTEAVTLLQRRLLDRHFAQPVPQSDYERMSDSTSALYVFTTAKGVSDNKETKRRATMMATAKAIKLHRRKYKITEDAKTWESYDVLDDMQMLRLLRPTLFRFELPAALTRVKLVSTSSSATTSSIRAFLVLAKLAHSSIWAIHYGCYHEDKLTYSIKHTWKLKDLKRVDFPHQEPSDASTSVMKLEFGSKEFTYACTSEESRNKFCGAVLQVCQSNLRIQPKTSIGALQLADMLHSDARHGRSDDDPHHANDDSLAHDGDGFGEPDAFDGDVSLDYGTTLDVTEEDADVVAFLEERLLRSGGREDEVVELTSLLSKELLSLEMENVRDLIEVDGDLSELREDVAEAHNDLHRMQEWMQSHEQQLADTQQYIHSIRDKNAHFELVQSNRRALLTAVETIVEHFDIPTPVLRTLVAPNFDSGSGLTAAGDALQRIQQALQSNVGTQSVTLSAVSERVTHLMGIHDTFVESFLQHLKATFKKVESGKGVNVEFLSVGLHTVVHPYGQLLSKLPPHAVERYIHMYVGAARAAFKREFRAYVSSYVSGCTRDARTPFADLAASTAREVVPTPRMVDTAASGSRVEEAFSSSAAIGLACVRREQQLWVRFLTPVLQSVRQGGSHHRWQGPLGTGHRMGGGGGKGDKKGVGRSDNAHGSGVGVGSGGDGGGGGGGGRFRSHRRRKSNAVPRGSDVVMDGHGNGSGLDHRGNELSGGTGNLSLLSAFHQDDAPVSMLCEHIVSGIFRNFVTDSSSCFDFAEKHDPFGFIPMQERIETMLSYEQRLPQDQRSAFASHSMNALHAQTTKALEKRLHHLRSRLNATALTSIKSGTIAPAFRDFPLYLSLLCASLIGQTTEDTRGVMGLDGVSGDGADKSTSRALFMVTRSFAIYAEWLSDGDVDFDGSVKASGGGGGGGGGGVPTESSSNNGPHAVSGKDAKKRSATMASRISHFHFLHEAAVTALTLLDGNPDASYLHVLDDAVQLCHRRYMGSIRSYSKHLYDMHMTGLVTWFAGVRKLLKERVPAAEIPLRNGYSKRALSDLQKKWNIARVEKQLSRIQKHVQSTIVSEQMQTEVWNDVKTVVVTRLHAYVRLLRDMYGADARLGFTLALLQTRVFEAVESKRK